MLLANATVSAYDRDCRFLLLKKRYVQSSVSRNYERDCKAGFNADQVVNGPRIMCREVDWCERASK